MATPLYYGDGTPESNAMNPAFDFAQSWYCPKTAKLFVGMPKWQAEALAGAPVIPAAQAAESDAVGNK